MYSVSLFILEGLIFTFFRLFSFKCNVYIITAAFDSELTCLRRIRCVHTVRYACLRCRYYRSLCIPPTDFLFVRTQQQQGRNSCEDKIKYDKIIEAGPGLSCSQNLFFAHIEQLSVVAVSKVVLLCLQYFSLQISYVDRYYTLVYMYSTILHIIHVYSGTCIPLTFVILDIITFLFLQNFTFETLHIRSQFTFPTPPFLHKYKSRTNVSPRAFTHPNF